MSQLNYTEAKEPPSWMTAPPEQKFDQVDLLNDLEVSRKPSRELTGESKNGETFHLQQDYWKGNIIVGRWARQGSQVAREPRPSFQHPPSIKFGRDVVKPQAMVGVGDKTEVATTLVVESCDLWFGKMNFVALFKIPAAIKTHLVETGLKAHKVITLDGQDYLRCEFSLPAKTLPDWFKRAVDTVGDVAVEIQLQTVLNPVPMAYDGWCEAWFDLAISNEARVPAGPELLGYLDVMAVKRSKEAFIRDKVKKKKDQATKR